MSAFSGFFSDVSLTATAVVVWVVAISIAFGCYVPVLRARARAAAARAAFEAHSAMIEDLDHAPASPAAVFPEPAQAVEPAAPPAFAEVAPTLPAPESPQDFSVLIVDDNDTNRLVLEMILDSVGVAHASVVNGLEAVEAMTTTAYQAVLMDLQMPIMDGFEATRRIRAMESQRGGHSSIIVVSANCLEEHVAASHAAGADQHLAKPISAVTLLGLLESSAQGHCLAA